MHSYLTRTAALAACLLVGSTGAVVLAPAASASTSSPGIHWFDDPEGDSSYADITSYGVEYSSSAVGFVAVSAPYNYLSGDRAIALISTDGEGAAEFGAVADIPSTMDGKTLVSIFDLSGEDPVSVCDGTFVGVDLYDSSQQAFELLMAPSCLGNPESVRVRMSVGNADYIAEDDGYRSTFVDDAPNAGWSPRVTRVYDALRAKAITVSTRPYVELNLDSRYAAQTATLQVKRSGKWVTVGRAKLDRAGNVTVRVPTSLKRFVVRGAAVRVGHGGKIETVKLK
jgi:hypothetical protein